MRRLLWGWALAALLLVPPATAQGLLARGEAMPAFTGTSLDGSAFDSAELAESAVLIDFWGVWCPPCIDAFPKLSRLHDEFFERGFQVIGLAVLSGTPEEVAEFLDEYEVTYPIVLVEREVADAFGVLQYPSYFLIDAEGSLTASYPSRPYDLYQVVADDLEKLLPAVPASEDAPAASAPSP